MNHLLQANVRLCVRYTVAHE